MSEDTNKHGHKWTMVVDLDKCTGCQACVVACHAENNVPISSEEEVIKTAREVTTVIIIIGIIFTLLTALVSLGLGKLIAGPIVALSTKAQAIGDGRLDTRARVLSNDETGSLAKSLNQMAENLQDTMTSRDNLRHEIKQRKKTEEALEFTIQELKEALEKVKVLSGLLPICSYCKKIKDDQGYWNQIEVYIRDHSEAEFSHGICKDCAKEHFPDFDLYGK